MMTFNEICVEEDSPPVRVEEAERELRRRLHRLERPGEPPPLRAQLSNLIIIANPDDAASLAAQVPGILAIHPARVLFVVAQPAAGTDDLTASVCLREHQTATGRRIFSEQITLHAARLAVSRIPYVLRGLVVGELPINVWWALPQPPPAAGALFQDLVEPAQQVIYDSIGWPDPPRGIAMTAAWLACCQSEPCHWRAVADLNWRRLKYWRRLLAQAVNPLTVPGALESISEVVVEHTPHAVIQAWLLVSWLASRLHWKVNSGRFESGVQILWQFQSPQGEVRTAIRRHAAGSPELRRVRLSCMLDGKAGAIDLTLQEGRHLSAVPERQGVAARTIIMRPHSLADMVGHQLSDRERDPIFDQAMFLARNLALTYDRA